MSSPRPDPTCRRLLEAAGEVFAEKGFRAATVREICTRAKANIAAVNYHFGDKSELYGQSLAYAHSCAHERHPSGQGTRPDDPPRVRLHAFVRSFLLRVLEEGRPAWHGRLMCREMNEPTPTSALDDLVRTQISARFEHLQSILREIAPSSSSPEQLRLCAMSTIAQCLHYRLARPVIDRLFPGRYGLKEVEQIADHITRFTIAGASDAAVKRSPKRERAAGKAAAAQRRREYEEPVDEQRRHSHADR